MYKRGDAIWRLEKKLNNLENQKKITQTELASVLKTTKQNIYKYETGINLNICVVHYHLLQLAQYEKLFIFLFVVSIFEYFINRYIYLLFYKLIPVAAAEVSDAETISTLEIGYSGHSLAACNTISSATVVS